MKKGCTDAHSDWRTVKRGEGTGFDLDATIWIHVYSVRLLFSSCQVFFLVTSCVATADRQHVCMEGAHRHAHRHTCAPRRTRKCPGVTCT